MKFEWDPKKAKANLKKAKDQMRAEYKRSDFARLERGKFFAEVAKGTAVALLDPPIAKAFPTSAAVNKALHGLLARTEQTSRITMRSTGRRVKRGGATR
jgi:hypothetical protein